MGGAGEDELCGRLLAFKQLHEESFADLPPHFDDEGMERLRSIGYNNLINGYSSYSAGYRGCIPFYIALILFQLPTLKEWWPAGHPVWGSRLFITLQNEDISFLREHILTGQWHCKDSGMTASGVPMCVKQLQELREMRKEFNDYKRSQEQKLDAHFTKQTKDLHQMLKSDFVVEGVAQLTITDMKYVLEKHTAEVKDMLESSLTQRHERNTVHHVDLPEARLYDWPGDSIPHFVPFNYAVPLCDVTKMWRLWFIGDSINAIGPLSQLHAHYRQDVARKCQMNLTLAKRVMSVLHKIALDAGEECIDMFNCNVVCQNALKELMPKLYASSRKGVPGTYHELAYTTIAKLISVNKIK